MIVQREHTWPGTDPTSMEMVAAVHGTADERVVDPECEADRTGASGDGRAFVLPLDDAVGVQACKRGDAVL